MSVEIVGIFEGFFAEPMKIIERIIIELGDTKSWVSDYGISKRLNFYRSDNPEGPNFAEVTFSLVFGAVTLSYSWKVSLDDAWESGMEREVSEKLSVSYYGAGESFLCSEVRDADIARIVEAMEVQRKKWLKAIAAENREE